MKIVEIINSLSLRGGAEVFLHSLVKEFAKHKEHELLVIPLFSTIHETFKDIGCDNVKMVTCGKRKGLDIKAAKKLKTIIDDFSPDVVHTHLSCSPTLFLAYGFKKHKWKYFHTVHNQAEKESGKIVSFINKQMIKKRIMQPIGISNQITKSIQTKYKIENVPTINNGCSLFANAKLSSFKNREFDFICVARFYEQKNHIFLLKSFKKYLENNKNSKLLLVGDGILKQECEEYCLQNDLNKNVIFAGAVNNIFEYLNNSKVLVLTSIFEGNPICILEAMSAGLPIVSSNVGGVPDIVANGRNGYLFEVNNSDEFLDKIKNASNEANWTTFSKNNLEDSKRYSIEKCCEDYINEFEKNNNFKIL